MEDSFTHISWSDTVMWGLQIKKYVDAAISKVRRSIDEMHFMRPVASSLAEVSFIEGTDANGNPTKIPPEALNLEQNEFNSEVLQKLSNIEEAMSSLPLITYDEFKEITNKPFTYFYVAKDAKDKERHKCWRIYLRSQLVGEFNVDGSLTIPKFPMRFPFRFA